jgi:hypothetical protein
MRLGACYNLFDSEELLEASILSIRNDVDYIVVVYQTISNFGNKASPHLEELLFDLKNRGLIDELVHYATRSFSVAERLAIVSPRARPEEVGGSVETIGEQFMNETSKRELGRQKCLAAGCTHFMSMDADECYKSEELRYAKEQILLNRWTSTTCRMRTFFKTACYEYWPPDEINAVPFICACRADAPIMLAHPHPAIVDPTRRTAVPESALRHRLFERGEVEMYHYSFVRRDIASKLRNVSNKANYGLEVAQFLQRWNTWRVSDGVLHPHPYIGRLFSEVRVVENWFNIDLEQQCAVCAKSYQLFRCSQCRAVRYCCREHQLEHWPLHRATCQRPAQ